MEVIRSKILGYCHGVSNTLRMALECIEKGKKENVPCFCIGELIHNKDVVRSVEQKGLRIIRTSTDVQRYEDCKRKTALIRAHGIPAALREEFVQAGFELFDATCVNIKRSVYEIKKAEESGRTVVIIGVRNHAETLCLMGNSEKKPYLVSGVSDLEELFAEVPPETPLSVIVQTTFKGSEFEELSLRLKNFFKDIVFANKLCPDCTSRKRCVAALSKKCKAIVVVGGKNSENTGSLAKYSEDCGASVFWVENAEGFNPAMVAEICRFKKVGVCSGTSTPIEVINDVCKYLEKL